MGRHDDLKVAAEVTLAAVNVSAVLALDNLFLDGSFYAPLILQVLVAHITVAALRRARLNPWLAGLAITGTSALAISWSQYAGTLWVLVPSGATWSTLTNDFSNAMTVLNEDSVPLTTEPGFIAALSLIIWLVAVIADWAAFRAKLSFEPLLPSAVFVLLTAAFNQDQGLGFNVTFYITASLLFLLLHRTWRQEATATWAGVHRQLSRRSLLITGGVLTVVAVGVGSACGPILPGADDAPIVDLNGEDDEDDTRVVISPLVDIQGRLVDNPDIEVFQVRTGGDPGSYWRTTALDEFDGQIWRSSYQTEEADGALPRTLEPDTQTRTLRQEITISALGQIWLPAAAEARAVEAPVPVTYDEQSGTLMVDDAYTDSDGLTYAVESSVPDLTGDELRQASTGDIPSSIRDRYLQLPDNFDDRVLEEAERITSGSETPYDQAIALQNHFRENFEYDLGVTMGHDEDAIVSFLFGDRRGYCEQFAGAYAAMARTLGIPSRLAIGFTNGTEDPNEPGLFRVQAKHAHAWVELYFAGYGWVPFEPTPTRGPTDAENWLGIPAQQAGEEPAPSPSDTVAESDAVAEGPSEGEGEAGPGEPDFPDPDALPEGTGVGAEEEDESSEGWFSWRPRADMPTSWIPSLLVPLVAYCLLVPTALLALRARRRKRARRPEDQVALAWKETLEEAQQIGVAPTRSMTLAEKAALLRTRLPEAQAAIEAMTEVLERSLYAEQQPTPEEVAGVWRHADHAIAELTSRQSRYQRLLGHLDFRRLLPRHHPAPG